MVPVEKINAESICARKLGFGARAQRKRQLLNNMFPIARRAHTWSFELHLRSPFTSQLCKPEIEIWNKFAPELIFYQWPLC